MMDIKAFYKACFDLVAECENGRANGLSIADLLVKHDENGFWIRFTAIGSLLDYCADKHTGSVFSYCINDLLIIMHNALEGGD